MNPSPNAEQELTRLRRALRERIRDAGLSLREVETRLGMGTDYLSQLLRGSMDLKAKHLFAVLELLEVDAGEFFLGLFPAAAPQPRLDEEFIAVRQDVSIAVIRSIVRALQERGFISAEEAQRLLEPFEIQEQKR
ncbi:MAG: helix-turn-helix domain-containing protein [Thermoanaerobaculia bacterium]